MINKIDAFLKNYLGIIFIVLAFAITITFTLSYFRSSTERFNSALVYISPLEYDIKINNQNINNVIVPVGKSTYNIKIHSLNDIETFYKLVYQNNNNLVVKYKENNDSTHGIIKDNINNIKLVIENNSNVEQTLYLDVVGGYITDSISNIHLSNGYAEINEAITIPVNNCTYNGNLTQGAEYVNGQYTYRYKQEMKSFSWSNINDDGWGVILTDKDSTGAVTTPLCTSINGKPIVSMSFMFYASQATSIDLSSFDTSKVTNMRYMLDSINATTLDLSNFDTSNVIDMGYMFAGSQVATLDFSSFDTSNVTDMSGMFYYTQTTILDLSSFDTSKVTNMNGMFRDNQATTLDLSSFDTSSVTDMSYMFYGSKATTLDLNSFDTSNVTNMSGMFRDSKATILDLNSFDTSNVTNMGYMFNGSQATTIYVSNKWNTSNVTNSSSMFNGVTNLVGGEGTTYNSSNPRDKTYAHVDGGVSNPGYFTYKASN